MKSIPRFYIVLFIFFLSISFSFVHKPIAVAYNPSEQHAVRSVPETPENSHQINGGQSSSKQDMSEEKNLTENVLFQLFQQVSDFLKSAGEFWLLSFLTGVFFFGRVAYSLVSNSIYFANLSLQFFVQNLSHQLEQYGLAWMYFSIISAFSPFSIMNNLMNTTTLFIVQNILKSGVDVQIRLGVAITALIVGTATKSPFKQAYKKFLQTFEKKTHWKVGNWQSDALWVGGFATVAAAVMGGEALFASSPKSPAFGGLSESLGTAISYVIKESRSAFTETEKECEAREDNCHNMFDKGVILAFNYLPGTMPDLGLADAVIRFKKGLFEEPNDPEQISDLRN